MRRCRFPFRFLISIHAPRTGSDGSTTTALATTFYFNPRSPHGERQLFKRSLASTLGFQSTLPARGATDGYNNITKIAMISIHAPRTGSDCHTSPLQFRIVYFNPRSPHGERLCGAHGGHHADGYFNPRSPHGERRQGHKPQPRERKYFNPRSPHGERRIALAICSGIANFNPRSPHGERQQSALGSPENKRISIHAPRTGSDRGASPSPGKGRISIHAPRTGSDPTNYAIPSVKERFQSTLPARGATRRLASICPSQTYFNPRSPHGERLREWSLKNGYADFNPRSPHGERLDSMITAQNLGNFNPRSPHGERQRIRNHHSSWLIISIHAPRTGSDKIVCMVHNLSYISIHAPRTGSD